MKPTASSLFSPAHPISGFAHVNPQVITPNPSETGPEYSPVLLCEKLLGDVVVAVGVTALAAPFLTVIDKALVQRSVVGSSQNYSIWSSSVQSVSSILRNPVTFLRSPTYLWMWGTYAATYSAANTLRTLTEHPAASEGFSSSSSRKSQNSAESSTPPVSKTASTTLFVGTAVVNSSASLMKDRAYAKLYGSVSAAASVPNISYALWVMRDFTVIGAAFVLPSHVAAILQQQTNLSQSDSHRVAQLVTPVAAQLIAGPLHFVGLDCYNRNLTQVHRSLLARVTERSRFLATGFVEIVAARMVRILPGYGIAGVLNTELRGQWREQLIQRRTEWSGSMVVSCMNAPEEQQQEAVTTVHMKQPYRLEPNNRVQYNL